MINPKLQVVTEDGVSRLDYDVDPALVSDRDSVRSATREDVTLEAMATLLDNKCGARNAHDFNGTHRALALILLEEIGRDKATYVFETLVYYDALPGLTGVAGFGNPEMFEDDYADIFR